MDSNSLVTSDFNVQKIGKDKSPLLPKEKDTSYNVRDRLNDVLLCEKHIIGSYGTGIRELICEQLTDTAEGNMNTLKGLHQNVLISLFDLGEYQADTATPMQIEDAWDMFNNYKIQLPYQNK